MQTRFQIMAEMDQKAPSMTLTQFIEELGRRFWDKQLPPPTDEELHELSLRHKGKAFTHACGVFSVAEAELREAAPLLRYAVWRRRGLWFFGSLVEDIRPITVTKSEWHGKPMIELKVAGITDPFATVVVEGFREKGIPFTGKILVSGACLRRDKVPFDDGHSAAKFIISELAHLPHFRRTDVGADLAFTKRVPN